MLSEDHFFSTNSKFIQNKLYYKFMHVLTLYSFVYEGKTNIRNANILHNN